MTLEKTCREILNEQVFDASVEVLKNGSKFEIETYEYIKEYNNFLRYYNLSIIEDAVLDLVDMGLLKHENNEYSLNQ